MSNELVKLEKEDYTRTQTGIAPMSITDAITIAKAFYVSKLFPDLANEQQATVKIMAGAEYGIPPFQSLNAFHIVKGKVMLHYSTIGAIIRRTGYDYRANESTGTVASITFFNRSGEEVGTEVVTLADAQRMGTQNLDKRASTMLFARAISQGARKYVPEVFNGAPVYALEERDEIERGTSDEVAEKLSDVEVPDDFADPLLDAEFTPEFPPEDEYAGPTVTEDQGALV
jgi:hypothetical protein